MLLRVLDLIENHANTFTAANAESDYCRMEAGLLLSHTDIEDELLFPAMEPLMKEYGPLVINEHRAEHREIARLFRKAIDLGKNSLMMSVEAVALARKHFDREEKILFPLAEKLLSQTIREELGRKALKYRDMKKYLERMG